MESNVEDGKPVKTEKLIVEDGATHDEDGAVSKPEDSTQTMSKSQLKKLKRREKWDQVKTQKRKAFKERAKARKRACRERGEEVGPTRKQLRYNTMAKSSCKVQVVIDCDFDEYMVEKDIRMLVKQIQFSYSANRRSENPLQFHCCGVLGKTKERLEGLGDYKGWDVRFHGERYDEMFEKPSLVYLSSESPNVLQTLDEDKVYIIGGLVDHNHHKGLCHRLAEEKKIEHAQLPIADYLDMKTRKVLAINHVFEILLHYTETQDWQKAFYTVLPARKGAVPKALGVTGDAVENTDSDNNSSKDGASENGREHSDNEESDSNCCATDKPAADSSLCTAVDNGENAHNDMSASSEPNQDNSENVQTTQCKQESEHSEDT